MAIETLPVIDLSALDREPEAKAAELDKLLKATHEVGFFYLKGHDFPDTLPQEVLSSARKFFALPTETKREIENLRSPQFRGYTLTGNELTQNITDWREQIDIAVESETANGDFDPEKPWSVLQGPNQWPTEVPELRNLVSTYLEHAGQTSNKLLRAWAEALGQEATVFEPAFEEAFPTFKIVHYPGHDGSVTTQGVGEHKDVGVLTLLYIEPNSTGLQVLTDEGWIDAPAKPGHFVVNIGELLEAATGGYLKATVHRVKAQTEGIDRYSLPYFYNPALHQSLPQLELPAPLAEEATGAGLDSHGDEIKTTYGLNALKSRLRAHPEVAKKFHSNLITLPEFAH